MSPRSSRSALLALTGALLLALSACVASPGDDQGDMAGQMVMGKCKAGDTKACGCLGSTTSGTKTCDAKGVFGTCNCMGGTGDPSMSDPNSSSGTPTTPQSACGSCNGCCDGKTCVPFADETDTKCGVKGKSCSSCGSGLTCDTSNGKCVNSNSGSGCSASCDGCCSASNGCVGYQDTDSFACGVNGSTCQACPVEGGLCDDTGSCTDKPAYYMTYQISIRQIDMSGIGCDTAAGAERPDPFVCLVAWDTTTNKVMKDFDGNDVSGCSKYCTDSGLCNLSVNSGIVTRKSATGSVVPVEFPGDALTGGHIYVYAYDWDGAGASHDLLGQGLLPVVSTLSPGTAISAGPYSASTNFGCNVPIQFQVAYVF